MKNVFFLVLLFNIALSTAIAQQKAEPVYFSGIIKTNRDSLKLYIIFNKNPIVGLGEGENDFIKVAVDKTGKFNFSLPAIDRRARMSIIDFVTYNSLFSNQIVEPGDKIYLDATIMESDTISYFKAKISGKGAAKYLCKQELDKSGNEDQIWKEKDPARLVQVCDSIFADKRKILDRFKSSLNQQTYQLIMADVEGDLKAKIIQYNICKGVYADEFPKEKKATMERNLSVFTAKESALPQEVLAMSSAYPVFLYELAKIQLTLSHNGRHFELKDLYQKLKAEYTGVLRDKLLAYCLLNDVDLSSFYENTEAGDYTACIKDARGMVETPWLKQTMDSLFFAKATGTNAFNFTLPADSSGRMVSLEDLRGKVILMDIWAFQCPGCNAFSKVFHEKIYPLFKNNPEFTVVSVMGDISNRAGYMRRLRGENNTTYTYPNYINLFAGQGVEMGRMMAKHYKINSWPLILLITKDGRIFSATVPFFTDDTSPNVEKLITLIKEAIQQT